MKYFLEIKPALKPEDRHKIEDVLKRSGYNVHGGGQMVDGSSSDISFSDKDALLGNSGVAARRGKTSQVRRPGANVSTNALRVE